MARKRARGGGRKPRGGSHGLTDRLNLRVRPSLRMQLEKYATTNAVSLAQEVIRRLDESVKIERDPPRAPHIAALITAVETLATMIERGTGTDWHKDPWTGEALRAGLQLLLDHFAPRLTGSEPVPEGVKRATVRDPVVADHQTPEGFGQLQAFMLISMIEITRAPEGLRNQWPPTTRRATTSNPHRPQQPATYPDQLIALWEILRDLGRE
jgi:hypothetical protein